MEEELMQKIIKEVGIVPEQVEGNELIIHTTVQYPDAGSARSAYLSACQRLMQVNRWAEYMDSITATFQLCTSEGEPVETTAQEGLFIQVDLPAPGTLLGRGYDWVRIEAYNEGKTALSDFMAFRVRPTYNPRSKEEGIAHFYGPKATVTWVVYRDNDTNYCVIFDRNLTPNMERSCNYFVDLVRNTAIGAAAAGGMSKVQWEKMVQAILPSN